MKCCILRGNSSTSSRIKSLVPLSAFSYVRDDIVIHSWRSIRWVTSCVVSVSAMFVVRDHAPLLTCLVSMIPSSYINVRPANRNNCPASTNSLLLTLAAAVRSPHTAYAVIFHNRRQARWRMSRAYSDPRTVVVGRKAKQVTAGSRVPEDGRPDAATRVSHLWHTATLCCLRWWSMLRWLWSKSWLIFVSDVSLLFCCCH